jgi:hypothetical protein
MATTYELRPMTIGTLLDRAFTILRRRFVLFAGITLVACTIPDLVIGFAQTALVRRSIALSGSVGNIYATNLIVLLLAYTAAMCSQAVASHAVLALYLGEEITIGQAFARTRSSFARLLGLALLSALALSLAFLLCFLPCVFVAVLWCIATPALALESLAPAAALRRSSQLVRRHRGRALVLGLLVSVLLMAVMALLVTPVAVIMSSSGGAMRDLLPAARAFTSIAGPIGNLLLVTLANVLVAVFYFDLRIRKEGFDVESLILRLDAPAAPAPVA